MKPKTYENIYSLRVINKAMATGNALKIRDELQIKYYLTLSHVAPVMVERFLL